MKPSIAQATVVFNSTSHGFEFTVSWCQNFEIGNFLKGKYFDHENLSAPLSTCAPGQPGTPKEVALLPTTKMVHFEDGKTYAALIGLETGKEVPFIICLADYIQWKTVQRMMQKKKSSMMTTATATLFQEIEAPVYKNTKATKPKRVHHRPQHVEVDPNTYSVDLHGEVIHGTLAHIMGKFCYSWAEDPTDALKTLATWKKKVAFRYVKCECPNLPPPNKMSIEAGRARLVSA